MQRLFYPESWQLYFPSPLLASLKRGFTVGHAWGSNGMQYEWPDEPQRTDRHTYIPYRQCRAHSCLPCKCLFPSKLPHIASVHYWYSLGGEYNFLTAPNGTEVTCTIDMYKGSCTLLPNSSANLLIHALLKLSLKKKLPHEDPFKADNHLS